MKRHIHHFIVLLILFACPALAEEGIVIDECKDRCTSFEKQELYYKYLEAEKDYAENEIENYQIHEGLGFRIFESDTELMECVYPVPECAECVDNSDSQHGPTLDDCIILGSGILCANGTCESGECCCDFETVAGEGGSVEACNCSADAFKIGKCDEDLPETPVAGGGSIPSGNDTCEKCMCIAEAGGEPAGACIEAVICTMRNRRDEEGGDTSLCDVVHATTSNGGRQFTAAKCMCDRKGDGSDPDINGGATAYNQTYCDCCVGSGELEASMKCLAAARNLDCNSDSSPYQGINSYRTHNLPDPPNCSRVNFPGSNNCGHKFFDC